MQIEVVVLAGGPRGVPLERVVGCPLFSLPLGAGQDLLACWILAIQSSRVSFSRLDGLRYRMLVSSEWEWCGSGVPANLDVVIEQRRHRGTAGALRDSCFGESHAASPVLVVELSACPAVEIAKLFEAWNALGDRTRACVIGESRLGRYCGVALCDRSLFELVPEVGFFDFKEQLLPAVRDSGGLIEAVSVAERARRVRTRAEWLDAVQVWREFTARSGVVDDRGPDSPEWKGLHSVISRTALTAGATVVSSIVMDEAVIEPGALVARSVIGPGMRVPAGARVVDAVLADRIAGEAVIRRSFASVTALAESE